MRDRVWWFVCVLGCTVTVASQQAPSDSGSVSTVSGHVYYGDTNAPARMTTIMLQPADAVDRERAVQGTQVATRAEGVQTLLDGSFLIRNVAPGDYYVLASAPGYISPLASLSRASGADRTLETEPKRRMEMSSLRVAVRPNFSPTVNITLQRGAAVSGTVSYDDGSPASDLFVTLLVQSKGQWVSIPQSPFDTIFHSAKTDDLGSYRINGLPAGEYALEVELALRKLSYHSEGHGGGTASSLSYALSIYSGGKTRSKDAVPFSLWTGEERHGEDIRIPISKLHSVQGSLEAAHDGHVLNGGNLMLLYADDKSMAGSASVTKDEDSFAFSFVPEGDYILAVNYAADNDYQEVPNPPHMEPPTRTETHPLHTYGMAELPIHVDVDLSDVIVKVPDAPAPTAGRTP
jgi:hypothetical protein